MKEDGRERGCSIAPSWRMATMKKEEEEEEEDLGEEKEDDG